MEIKLTQREQEKAKGFRDKKRKEEPNHPYTKSINKMFDKDKARDILKEPDYFKQLIKEVGKKVVGEETAISTILLVCLGGSLTSNAEPTSYNLMVNAKSGTGKDYVVKSVVNLMPSHNVVIRQRISPATLTYFRNTSMGDNWDWDGKVLYLEDISNEVLNHNVFIVMSSNRSPTTTIVINNKSVDISIQGKPTIVITTASPNPRQDLLRRFPIINLDERFEQSVAIMEHQAKMSMKGINTEYNWDIKGSLSLLEMQKVRIPFGDKLINLMSAHNVIIRTNFQRFLDYIKFSAVIHQFQRRKDEEEFIIAEPQDYEIGAEVFISTMSNIFSIPLNTNQQRILEVISKITKKQLKGNKLNDYNKDYPKYSVSELEPYINFISDKQLRRELKKLTDLGFLEMGLREREGFQKSVMVWSYKAIEKFELPKWDKIK